MERTSTQTGALGETPRRLARRMLTILENRTELLLVEVQEERERIVHAILLALGVAAFGMLAAMALSAAVTVLLWPYSSLAVLLTLTGLYGAISIYLYRRLNGLLHDWQTLSASLDQLRKDRACLEENLK
jgi:uncharacterized membrane protein YqjE